MFRRDAVVASTTETRTAPLLDVVVEATEADAEGVAASELFVAWDTMPVKEEEALEVAIVARGAAAWETPPVALLSLLMRVAPPTVAELAAVVAAADKVPVVFDVEPFKVDVP